MAELASGLNGLSALGWLQTPAYLPWLEADALRGADWVAARVWTAGTVSKGPSSVPDQLHIVMSVDGRGLVASDDREFALHDRQLAIVDANRAMRLSSSSPWARIEWVLSEPALACSRLLPMTPGPIVIDEVHWQMIATVSNVLVGRSGEDGAEHALPALERMGSVLAQMVISALSDAQSDRRRGTEGVVDDLFDRARSLIAARFSDPEYDVRRLRSDLSLSKSHLHRLFAERGTTPRRELEARRVDTALALSGASGQSRVPSEDVARAAGFPSTDRMMRAIGRRRGSLKTAQEGTGA